MGSPRAYMLSRTRCGMVMFCLDMKWYETCAEKSTENPMHMIRLIIDSESWMGNE